MDPARLDDVSPNTLRLFRPFVVITPASPEKSMTSPTKISEFGVIEKTPVYKSARRLGGKRRILSTRGRKTPKKCHLFVAIDRTKDGHDSDSGFSDGEVAQHKQSNDAISSDGERQDERKKQDSEIPANSYNIDTGERSEFVEKWAILRANLAKTREIITPTALPVQVPKQYSCSNSMKNLTSH